ncbi:hypothetical protein [Paraburkholderia flagellata]|uniref:Nmad3 family putative nucleotide modification protein n=1 Tax=Paraburkholderia flagellata TaxID=2883241 RepID=UPI002278BFB1|nr:hypothetical protein [Paraburkholderia flagellata]
MKIIFSRKGFDSQYGGVPSPILPDGSLQTSPIPSRYGRPLGDILRPLGPLHALASHLTQGAITDRTSVHLDPDLSAGSVARKPGNTPSSLSSRMRLRLACSGRDASIPRLKQARYAVRVAVEIPHFRTLRAHLVSLPDDINALDREKACPDRWCKKQRRGANR